MDDILASIRRILNEDEAPGAPGPARPAAAMAAAPGDVFALDASMLVAEPAKPAPLPAAVAGAVAAHAATPSPARMAEPAVEPRIEPVVAAADPPPEAAPVTPSPVTPSPGAPNLVAPIPVAAARVAPVAVPPEPSDPVPPSWPAPLIAPEAAAAAALSVGSLRRTLEAGRSSLAVRAGGPTLDDIVREELRPILKAWLDANLPPIVERAVRAEIERVVGRADL
jgi:cell pole-organizing protein PopZ